MGNSYTMTVTREHAMCAGEYLNGRSCLLAQAAREIDSNASVGGREIYLFGLMYQLPTRVIDRVDRFYHRYYHGDGHPERGFRGFTFTVTDGEAP